MSAKPLRPISQMRPRQNNLKRKKAAEVPWIDVDLPQSAKKRKIHLNGFALPVNGFPSPPPPGSPKKRRYLEKQNNLQEQRLLLPIASGRDAILYEIHENDVTIIVGETGSGKTTQVPQYIMESDSGLIAVTQPRRVAAVTLAERVSKEQDTKLGDRVGYSVRFDERTSPSTRIKYLTDGMIVREMLSDPLLSKYSVVIVDEAHERSLRTDLLLANLKQLLVKRNSSDEGKGKAKSNPLKIVVMSATLDAEKFKSFFSGSKILYVKGRQHPVKIFHAPQPQPDYVQSAMRTVFQIHTGEPEGDILVFLPGQEDIENLESSIKLFANRLPKDQQGILICPMFATQSHGKNAKVFDPPPPNTRKCILATNIAETSITIPGVKYVIDTGKCKENRYLTGNTGNGLDTLMTHDITKSNAMQRTGRAGREGPGVCYRLYTEESFNKMTSSPQPEILRVNLSASMLQLKALNFNIEKLDLMDKPNPSAVRAALINLWTLQAIDNKMALTPLGRQMAAFPLEPIYSRSLLASHSYGCTAEIIDIISVLSSSSRLFHSGGGAQFGDDRGKIEEARSKFTSLQGDHCRVLNIFRAYEEICDQQQQHHQQEGAGKKNKKERLDWCHHHSFNERALIEAMEIREQIRRHCERISIDPPIDWKASVRKDDVELRELKIVKALSHGLVGNSAVIQPDGRTYKQMLSQTIVKIHPSSVLAERKVSTIIFDELVFTNNIYARGVSMVPKSHILTLSLVNQRTK